MELIGRRQSMVGLLLATLGCRTESKSPPLPTSPPEQTYQVRGIVVAVRAEAKSIEIQHEAIPDFVAASGEKVGMPAMVMPFRVGPLVPLSEFRTGDKVRFDLEVRLHSQPELFIPSMSRLPDAEVLQVKEP